MPGDLITRVTSCRCKERRRDAREARSVFRFESCMRILDRKPACSTCADVSRGKRNYESATSDCWMYYLQDTRIQVHYNWQVANLLGSRASKLGSFLKRNAPFDVSVEYLMVHRYALYFIIYARLYRHRVLPNLAQSRSYATP